MGLPLLQGRDMEQRGSDITLPVCFELPPDACMLMDPIIFHLVMSREATSHTSH